MRKLLCELKYRVATEDRNNIIYETDCSNLEAVYFGESKRSLKSYSDERKRYVRNLACEKNKIAEHCWEQNKVVDRESRLIPWMVKETINFLRILVTITKIPTCFLKYGFLI